MSAISKSEYAKQWCKRNPEYTKQWRIKNPEKVREYQRRWQAKNRDHVRARGRRSYLKFNIKRATEARLNRKLRKLDPVKHSGDNEWRRKYIKSRKEKDVQFRLRWQTRTRILMSLKRGVAKAGPTVELLGCPISEYKSHLESLWTPGMSWHNYGKHGWHIDHITPCSTFDLSQPSEQKKCFHYSNTRPMWAQENLSTGGKLSPTKFFRRVTNDSATQ